MRKPTLNELDLRHQNLDGELQGEGQATTLKKTSLRINLVPMMHVTKRMTTTMTVMMMMVVIMTMTMMTMMMWMKLVLSID
jgi:long-subunit acyl-CoA synthetase (AMP-forming)